MSQSTARSSFGRLPAIFILLTLAIGFACILIKAFFGAPFIPKPGDGIDIRSNGVAILRLPTHPVQELEVYDDGNAIRYAYPIDPNHYAQIKLSADEQRAFEQLHIRWCTANLPSFALQPGEPFYDLAFRCDTSFRIKQAKVPDKMLPTFFTQLLIKLPDSDP